MKAMMWMRELRRPFQDHELNCRLWVSGTPEMELGWEGGWYPGLSGPDVIEDELRRWHDKYWPVVVLGLMNKSDSERIEKLTAVVEQLRKKGWEETVDSLSRRVFEKQTDKGGKWWQVALIGKVGIRRPVLDLDWAVEVHFGATLDRWHPRGGGKKVNEFASQAEALAVYEKMIKKKLAEGYVEVHERTPPYSAVAAPGEKQAKKAAPKSTKKPKVRAAYPDRVCHLHYQGGSAGNLFAPIAELYPQQEGNLLRNRAPLLRRWTLTTRLPTGVGDISMATLAVIFRRPRDGMSRSRWHFKRSILEYHHPAESSECPTTIVPGYRRRLLTSTWL
jgi:predicted DNA-binding WGR domain protein